VKNVSKQDGRSNFAKTCTIWRDRGFIECDNELHYRKVKMTPARVAAAPEDRREFLSKQQFSPEPIGNLDVLEIMKPYKEASCKCERAACKAAWSMNAPGVFQDSFVAPGAFHKGVGDPKTTGIPKRVMPVQFRLSADQSALLIKRFPDWWFVQVAAGGHDHPVSHVTTQVATYEAQQKLRGKRVLDIHGNPTANEAVMNQRRDAGAITTVVSLETPKDFLRQATKWGPEMQGNRRRYHIAAGLRDIAQHPERIAHDKDAFLGVHTAYYYPMREIANMLACSPNAPATFIMHKFDGQSGTLNNGELRWVKKDGMITQTNVLTNERYVHPDNSHWFNTSTWTRRTALEAHTRDANYDVKDGLTWTTNMCCEGTFIITAVAITSRAAHLDPLRLMPCIEDDAVLRWGGVDINVGPETHFVPIPGTHAKLFDELRAKMNFKLRDDKKFAAHVNTCEQKALLYNKVEGLVTDAKLLSRIQIASFWVDFETDCLAQTSLGESGAWMVRDQALAMSGKSMSRGTNLTTHIMRSVLQAIKSKSGVDAAIAVVDNAVLYAEARRVAVQA